MDKPIEEPIIDWTTDTITQLVTEISNQRRALFQEALAYFYISEEEITTRVKVYYTEKSMEEVFMDDQLVLTFSPLTATDNGIEAFSIPHYKTEENEE